MKYGQIKTTNGESILSPIKTDVTEVMKWRYNLEKEGYIVYSLKIFPVK